MRALCYFSFYFITDPKGYLFYCLSPLAHVGFYVVHTTVQSYVQSMYPAEIRGLLSSVVGIVHTLGQVFYVNICQWALQRYGPVYPFIACSILDVSVVVLSVALAICGLIGRVPSSSRRPAIAPAPATDPNERR